MDNDNMRSKTSANIESLKRKRYTERRQLGYRSQNGW